jgi:two-component system, NtrC family, sensor kinase
MKNPSIPLNEISRLSALMDYEILDTGPELSYDDITLLASSICEAPIAIISLIDKDRQWFKSKIGFDLEETPREISFCAHAINSQSTLVITDATKNPDFSDHPFVTAERPVVFYAGAPLINPNGLAMGTLCVVDHIPRELTSQQLHALEALSRQVVNIMELRKKEKILLSQYEELRQFSLLFREQEKQIVTSAKLSALGEMAAGIAHEINNPLCIISTSAYCLQLETEKSSLDTKKIKEMTKSILSTTERASHICRSLLSFSRKTDNIPPERASLRNIIRDTFSFCNHRFNTLGIEISVEDLEDIFVSCVAIEISQVILNLLNNSCDALEELDEKWIKISVFAEEGMVHLRVQDSGNGIPTELQQKIFSPFFTTKSVGKGVGMGLSISQGLAEKNKGSLNYEESERTTFVLSLPRAK